MADSRHIPAADRAEPPEELRDLIVWHGAWAAVVLAGLAAIAGGLWGLDWRAALALFVGAIPGLGGLVLRQAGGVRLHAILLGLWCVCGACACLLTGGCRARWRPGA